MKLIRNVSIAVGVLSTMALSLPAGAGEIPMLEEKVKAGKLPAMEKRLPEQPFKLDFAASGKEIGKYGGQMRLLMGRVKDIGQITVYTYARLMGYDEQFQLQADILESYDVKDGREFTFHLRKGHKWSDGEPFTTEDFRYYWEDMVKDPDLGREGVPFAMVVEGEEPKVEIVDETTIKYSWSNPNPAFLNALAGAAPLYIYRPAHYLKQFHAKYGDKEKLNAAAREAGADDWAAMHTRMQRQRRPENPDLPTLQAWHNTTASPSEHYVFERNPYFHRVDSEGNQLPYVDKLIMDVVSKDVIAAKTGSGEADLQARYLKFSDFTFLKEGEERNHYNALLWYTGKASEFALFPNLNTNDPVWRGLMRDVRFRRGLSLAINREEINQVVFFGLATPSANTVIPQSPLYKDEYRDAWSSYDPEQANKLLDEAGLSARGDDGFRLLPNGERAEIIVEGAGESNQESDVMELVLDHWKKVGIKAHLHNSQRDTFRSRALTGETMMSVFFGADIGLATSSMSPEELAPTSEAQLEWPKWGNYYLTQGKAGEPVDDEGVAAQLELYKKWLAATSDEERKAVWHEMLANYTDQVYTIGTVNNSRQPVVVAKNLKNVPKEGIYSWSPTAFFGVYKPDTFWYEK